MNEQDVTLRDVYRALGRIEEKFDNLAADKKGDRERLDKVEKRQTWAMGAGAGISFIVSVIVGALGLAR